MSQIDKWGSGAAICHGNSVSAQAVGHNGYAALSFAMPSPETIKQSAEVLNKTVQVLETSRTGWLKVMAVGIVGGAIAISVIVAQKIDPHRPLESIRKSPPTATSPERPDCQMVDDSIVCGGKR